MTGSSREPAALSGDSSLTSLLCEWRNGSPGAREAAFTLAYAELRNMASAIRRERSAGSSSTPTDLVHDAFIRVSNTDDVLSASRAGFFFVMSRAIHDLLVEESRSRQAIKRGGSWARQPLDGLSVRKSDSKGYDPLVLAELVERLAGLDANAADVARLRYVAGLSIRDCANVLDSSLAKVRGDWEFAKAWLNRELGGG